MSLLSAAAQDEDGDIISALRAENEMLRQSLLAMHNTLEMTARAGAHHARAASCLRETVIRWAARAEQAEEMLEAIGAGGVGSKVARQDHHEQHLNMVPEGWKLVPVEPTDDMLYDIQEYSHILPPRGRRIWAHMLAAAPQPPALEQPQPKREPIPNVMMDLGWELHGSNDAYQTWCMAVEWTELCHGIGGKK